MPAASMQQQQYPNASTVIQIFCPALVELESTSPKPPTQEDIALVAQQLKG